MTDLAPAGGRFTIWQMILAATSVAVVSASAGWAVGRTLLGDELNQYREAENWKVPDAIRQLTELSARLNVTLDERVVNEWATGKPLPWDLQFGYRWLKVRLKCREIALDLDARKDLLSLRGRFWRKGQWFTIDESSLTVNGVVQNSGLFDLCLVGLILGLDTSEGQFTIAPYPTLGKGMTVTCPDVAERVRRGLGAYEALLATKRTSA